MEGDSPGKGRSAWPWLLLALLVAARLWIGPGKVDPDLGHYSRGAKHWALYGAFGYEDLSTELIVPVHAWVTAGVFRALGPSYGAAAGLGLAETALAAALLILLLRREGALAACAAVLLFWTDYAVSHCARSGGAEPTQMLGIAALAAALACPSAGALRWAAAGFFLSWTILSKPTALVLVPAVLWRASWDGAAAAFRRLGWLVVGFLPIAAAAAAFQAAHAEAARSAWSAMRHMGGDHDRPPWITAGVWLFHWGNTGWRHTLAPLYLLALPLAAPLAFRKGREEDAPARWMAILAWTTLLAIAAFPPTGRRYVMAAFPLAYLAGLLVSRPARWEEAWEWLSTRSGKVFLCLWLPLALTPLLSYVKEPLAAWLHARTGETSTSTQSTAGIWLLAAAVALAAAGVAAAGWIAGLRAASWRMLVAGIGFLGASFLLVRVHGILGLLLGAVPHMEGTRQAVGREVVARAALVAGLSAAAGILAAALAWRLLARRGDERDARRRFLAACAWTFAVAGLLLPLWRELHTPRAPSALPGVSRELAARIEPGSTVYGGRYADVALLSVPCKVVTPWGWYHHDVEPFVEGLGRYGWNLPIERFRPGYLLLEDEQEEPAMAKVWGPLLSGIEREPIGEWTLDKHRLRLYRIRREEAR